MVPPEYETRIETLSNAANRFQLNFLKELCKQHEVKFYSYIGLNVEASVRAELGGEMDGVTYFYKSNKLLASVLKYKKAVRGALRDADCIITYNVVYAWMFCPILAKRMRKKSMLILADYSPEEAYSGRIRRRYAKIQLNIIKKYDIVIGLSEKTKALLNPTQKFICVEGGIDQTVYDFFRDSTNTVGKVTRFMYAGLLEPVTGIDRLVEAFVRIDNPDMRMCISGKGTLKDKIIAAGERDSRIEYLGCVPYEEYLWNLKNADVLVNPRNMDMPENENNFPSKIMEYLATGKPIISTKFPGYEKFSEYITFCDSSVDGIQKALESRDVQEHDSIKNREFASRFIWENQVERISRLLTRD